MAKTKQERLTDALDKCRDGLEALREIAEEVTESRDNMSGTNLENTERYQRYDEGASYLEGAVDSIESAIDDADIEL
jgi:hypothetical protein